ncbi:MAG: UDP-glucose--hexose-1-phosphate uridylyltransferase [Chloroflexi bacterium]|nr:UDP-glucose--hexose-1-phosphate uridylyltransferase [Chloroflexota bacterium]
MHNAFFRSSHRRYNPLTQEWVLVSPQRLKRPWQGQIETAPREILAPYDPNCYLCPGNARAGGARNPDYRDTFVFDNDFAALVADAPRAELNTRDLLRATSARGICRVICFSPRHDLTLPVMEIADIRRVVEAWCAQTHELGKRDFIEYVQIFENKSAMMGASNPHPHCQVWATDHIPSEPAKELRAQATYLNAQQTCLLCDYLDLEIRAAERIVAYNDHFVALVPFWAVWPFETMVLARRHIGALPDLNDAERIALAEIIKRLTRIFDQLFHATFPYSMGFHQTPNDGMRHAEIHLHAHYYPPLLRSATIRKFLVGYEMLAEPQRDITPELAAKRLREIYKK